MSKANFYRIQVKTKTACAPRRPRRLKAQSPGTEARQSGHAHQESRRGARPNGRPEARTACHPAPQLRRNRRFWVRRLGLDKTPR